MQNETKETYTKEDDGTITKVTVTTVTQTGLKAADVKKQLEARKAALELSKTKIVTNQDARIAEVTASLTAIK